MKAALTIVVCLAMLTAGLAGFAQSAQTITLSESNTQLKDIFKEIRRQAGYEFVVDSKTLATATPVTINVKNATLEEVLTICFKGQPITYTIQGNTIVVKPIEKTESKIEPQESTSGTLHYVSGRITDSKGGAVPGVNILIRGTSEGTVSDADGKYSLQVTGSDLLLFSFIGFKRFETEVGERTVVDVVLEEETAQLNAVTVNAGYYDVKQTLATGNISKITAKEIERQPVTSPLMALQGRMPGVDIAPSNGVAGSFANVVIRGRNSISNPNATPLYVVDGVPLDSRPLKSDNPSVFQSVGSVIEGAGGFDPLSGINPSNIESYEVLKDADATAIYGSRGANGVILITTKRGKQSEKTNVDINFYSGAGQVPRFLNLLTTPQYVAIRKEAFANDKTIPTAALAPDLVTWDPNRYTDWQKELLGGTANIFDVQANVSGGNQFTSFRFGGGYHKEGMVEQGDFGFHRINGNFNLNHTTSNRKFRASVAMNYGVTINNLFSSAALMQTAVSLAPNAPALYDAAGNLNWENGTFNNPLATLRRTDNTQGASLLLNTNLAYDLFSGFSIKLNVGYNTLDNSSNIKVSPFSAMNPVTITSNTTASSSFGLSKRNGWIVEPQIVYDYKVKQNQLNIVFGGSVQENSSTYQLISAEGYSSDLLLESLKGATKTTYITDDNSDYRYMAVFGRVGYTVEDKYLLNLTARRDGSSRFGPGRRWGNFGAIGAGWVFSEENFARRLSFLSFGKIRGSYGITGSDQVGDYQYRSTYGFASYGYQGKISLSPSGLANSNYAWEQSAKFEVAIELGFLKDRIHLLAAQFINRCSNQLLQYQLPSITGFSGVTQNLNATVENKGLELSLTTVNIERANIKWTSSFNITIPTNKLVSYPGLDQSADVNRYIVGQPLNIVRLYNYVGVNPATGLYQVTDVDGNSAYDDKDKTSIQMLGRKYFGGFNNTISYNGIELSIFFQFASQTSQVALFESPGGSLTNLREEVFQSHWQKDGDLTKYSKATRDASGSTFASYANNSNASIINSSFIRLKTASLSYTFPRALVTKARLQAVKIFLQGQNLVTFSKAITLDPEVGIYGLPPLRIVTAGIEMRL